MKYLDKEYSSFFWKFVANNKHQRPQTVAEPKVQFESSPDDLWTLILTNPDGNLYENDKECLHWFV